MLNVLPLIGALFISQYTDMEGRVNRRVDTLIVNIILGRTSQRCQRILQLKGFNRVAQVALHDEVRDSMAAGLEIVAAGKVCHLARSIDADALASANGKTVLTFRVAASRPKILAAASSSLAEPTVLDKCIWPPSIDAAPQEPSDDACTCHQVKLVYDPKTQQGQGFCTCPKSSAFLCKHIDASILLTGGFEVCGIARTALRLQEDPDFVEDSDEDEGLAMTVDSEDDESVDAEVEDNSAARAELHSEMSSLVQSMKALLISHSKLPKAERDDECHLAIYELEDFIKSRDTTIKPAARAHAFIRRAVPGPRPIPTSARAETFRHAQGIGRPPMASKAIHRVPLLPKGELDHRLASRLKSAAGAGIAIADREVPLVPAAAAAADIAPAISPTHRRRKTAMVPSSPDPDAKKPAAVKIAIVAKKPEPSGDK